MALCGYNSEREKNTDFQPTKKQPIYVTKFGNNFGDKEFKKATHTQTSQSIKIIMKGIKLEAGKW